MSSAAINTHDSSGARGKKSKEQIPPQSDSTFNEVNTLIWEHLRARDWHRGASRSLAISIALEANELLEHYQWTDKSTGSKEELAAELADILIYAFQFAQQNSIDIAEAIKKKLAASAQKYPATDFKGKQPEEGLQAYLTAKKKYRQSNS